MIHISKIIFNADANSNLKVAKSSNNLDYDECLSLESIHKGKWVSCHPPANDVSQVRAVRVIVVV